MILVSELFQKYFNRGITFLKLKSMLRLKSDVLVPQIILSLVFRWELYSTVKIIDRYINGLFIDIYR